jgi:hypothetical protein
MKTIKSKDHEYEITKTLVFHSKKNWLSRSREVASVQTNEFAQVVVRTHKNELVPCISNSPRSESLLFNFKCRQFLKYLIHEMGEILYIIGNFMDTTLG